MKQKLHLLMMLFLLSVGSAMAQSIQVLMNPKPSPYISDWQQQTETIKLIISNTTQNVIVVKIKSELLDGSSSVIAATDAAKMPEIEVSPGVTTYDASEVFPLSAVNYKGKAQNGIMQTGRIPDDNYQLCVALTDPNSNTVVGTSGTVCKSFSITAFQAPTLINPINNQEILETGVKGIVFRWTPIIPKPRDPVIYHLQVWEVLEGQTPMIALRTNQPIVEKDCKEILQTQWPIENSLPEAGKKYVWTVTPLDGEGRILLDGSGFSEPFVFSILDNFSKTASITLSSPAIGAKLTQEEAQNMSFRWTPIIPKPRDPVIYRLKVWQLIQGQKNGVAMRSNKPIVTKDVGNLNECKITEKITFPPGCIWQVEALDLKGNILSSSEIGNFSIIETMGLIELISPVNGAKLTQEEAQNMSFRWTPIIPKPRDPVIYRLKVWQLMQGQNSAEAMRSNKPIVTKDVDNVTECKITEKITFPPGCIWQVEALDLKGNILSSSGAAIFTVSSAGCGTNEAKVEIVCDKIIEGVQTYKVSINFNNVAAGGVQTCATIMNTITSTTGVLSSITSLPATIPANGNVTVTFVYAPSITNATTADFQFKGIWQDGNSNTSNFSKLNNKLPICQPKECCPGQWSKNIDESTGKPISHLANLGTFKCDEKRKFTFCYDCPKGCGESKIKYEILDASKNIVTTLDASNCTTTAVTFPNVSGAYELRVSGLCNGKVCNWLRYSFTVECKQNPTDCCKNSSIKSVDITNSLGTLVKSLDMVNCKNDTFKISPNFRNCDQYYLFSTNGVCGNNCKIKTIYTVSHAAFGSIASTDNTSISAASPSGLYTVKVDFYCGDQLCKTCTFYILKECNIKTPDCCKGGKWIPPFLTAPAPTLENKLDYVITNDPLRGSICGKDLQNVKCNSYINFRYAYQCATIANCKATITYVFKNGKTNEVLNTFSNIENGRNLAFLTPNVSGYYCMTAYAVCGDNVCDSCTVCFKLDCPPPVDCCKNSVQKDPDVYDAVTGIKVFELKCTQPTVFRINKTLKNCDKIFVIKANANCGSNPECQSKIVFKLNGTGYSNFGTGSIVIPSSLPNGNFILNVDYYCGDKICKSCKFEIVKDCKDTIPKNCCDNSSWGKVYYQKEKAYVNLSPTGGHLGTFNCKTLLPITANYNCAPGCGPAQIKYIVLHNLVPVVPAQTLPSGSTFNLTIPTNTSTNYNLYILAICNGVECAVGEYTFNVDCPSDSACCGGSDWRTKGILLADGWGPMPQCGATLGTYKCKVPKSFKFCYDCKQGCGPAKIKYEVINIATSLPEFSNIVSNCTSVSIPMNYANGSYQLNITALCGDKECATCRYNFKIECPANCCDSSGWKNGLYLFNDRGDILKPIYGGTIETYYINNNNKNCDIPITVWGWFLCNPKMKDCAGNVKYTLFNSAMTPVYSNTGVSLNIPATLSNGTYTLVVEGLCGNTVCRTDKLKIIKDCDQPDCCKGGKWENKNYTISAPLIKTTPIQVSCDKKYETTCIKDGSITFNANYICGTGANCTKKVYAKIYDSDGEEIMNLPLPISFSLINSGNYKITYYAKCGDKICDSCTFWVNIKSCPVTNCCDSSKWGTKTISWPGIKDKFTEGELPTKTSGMKMLPPAGATSYDPTGPIGLPPTSMDIECQMGYTLSQYGKYTFNANYNCADKTCASKVEVKITGTSSSVYNGTFTCPYTQKFDVADNYKIEYIAYCGGQICGRCEFQLLIEKNCCAGSKWVDAKYQLVNKKADGTWLFVPGINSLPMPGYGIPTLKADLGADISGLNYQCSDQKGCNVQYLVRRKNLTTGGLVVPDELLPLGQNTTSIYSQTYPQQVWIWGICGGQQCGSPISFKLECLNKDCVEPCYCGKGWNGGFGFNGASCYMDYLNQKPPLTMTAFHPSDMMKLGLVYECIGNNCPIRFQIIKKNLITNIETLIISETQDVKNPYVSSSIGIPQPNLIAEKDICSYTIIPYCNNLPCSDTLKFYLQLPVSSAIIMNGLLDKTKQMLSKEEVSNLLSPILKSGSVIEQLVVLKTLKGSYQMIAIANNEKLKLTQSIVVDLIENEKGFLSMAEKATITTQSMLPAQTKGASPGGGTCNKCGATFTDEQDFILHQENCEYTSVSAKLALKKPHGYVGHVTLLK